MIAFAVTGVTSGNLGLALRAGFTAFFTAAAMEAVGAATTGHKIPDFMSSAHLANMAGHALVGCMSAVMGGAKCGPGALSGAVGSFAGPIFKGLDFQSNLVAHAVVGGLASVAGGGNFANGAVTAAFGYLFNQAAGRTLRAVPFPQDDSAIRWELSEPSTEGGWIVQEVTRTVDGASVRFWEAWKINPGESTPSGDYAARILDADGRPIFTYNDIFTGSATVKSSAAFYEGLTWGDLVDQGFMFNNPRTPYAGKLPATNTTPNLPSPSTPPVNRTWP